MCLEWLVDSVRSELIMCLSAVLANNATYLIDFSILDVLTWQRPLQIWESFIIVKVHELFEGIV